MTTPISRAKAEAKAIAQEDGSALVPLAGQMVGVIRPGLWPADAVEHLDKNVFNVWARGCLTPAGLEIWLRVNPTIDQCTEFIAAWTARTGQDVGESVAS